MIYIKVVKLTPGALLPAKATFGSAGFDVYADLSGGTDRYGRTTLRAEVVIVPNSTLGIPTGLSMEIPPGYEVQVRSRSGMAAREVFVLNSPGTIDSDFRGEVKIILHNLGSHTYRVKHGDRIAQLVVAPVFQSQFVEVDALSATERGTGGFGSTGA